MVLRLSWRLDNNDDNLRAEGSSSDTTKQGSISRIAKQSYTRVRRSLSLTHHKDEPKAWKAPPSLSRLFKRSPLPILTDSPVRHGTAVRNSRAASLVSLEPIALGETSWEHVFMPKRSADKPSSNYSVVVAGSGGCCCEAIHPFTRRPITRTQPLSGCVECAQSDKISSDLEQSFPFRHRDKSHPPVLSSATASLSCSQRSSTYGRSDQSSAQQLGSFVPHPFGVWHSRRSEPTSLPHPPFRSASGHFTQQRAVGQLHTRNAHSLGDISDIIAKLPSRIDRGFVGYADVRTSGFPFIMPESGSEATNTPGSELASLHMARSRSDIGSIIERSESSDHDTHTVSRDVSEATQKADDDTLLRPQSFLSTASRQPLLADHHAAESPLPPTDEEAQATVKDASPDTVEGAKLPEHHDVEPTKLVAEHHDVEPMKQLAEHHDAEPMKQLAEQPAQDEELVESNEAQPPQVTSSHVHTQPQEVSESHSVPKEIPESHEHAVSEQPEGADRADTSESRDLEDHIASFPVPQLMSSHDHAASDALHSPSLVSESVTSSPIMKMRLLDTGAETDTISALPLDEHPEASPEAELSPQEHADARRSVSPSASTSNIHMPNIIPLPLGLQDNRATVSREPGQRAESELGHVRSPNKAFFFPSRSSAQFSTMSAQERSDILQGKPTKVGGSFIRRLIRRASLKGKSQSVGTTPNWVVAPARNSTALATELELREDDGIGASPQSKKGVTRRTSLGRRRRSRDGINGKQLRSTSFFSPFRAREPPAQRRRASFSTAAISSPKATTRDGLPSSASMVPLTQILSEAPPKSVHSYDFASRSEDEELLQTPPQPTMPALDDEEEDDDTTQRPSSQVTDRTDTSTGMGMALSSRAPFNFQDSLGLNELAASGRQQSQPAGVEAARSARGQGPASADSPARPKVSIPRMWQGIEPTHDADDMHTAASESEEDDEDYRAPDYNEPTSKFDTLTSSSSFRTAASSLDSPKHTAARRALLGGKPSKRSLASLDTPLARHFEQGSHENSPLADLITNLERKISNSGMAGRSAAYQDAGAVPSSEFLHLPLEGARHVDDVSPSPPLSDAEPSFPSLAGPSSMPVGSNTALVETVSGSREPSWAVDSEYTEQDDDDDLTDSVPTVAATNLDSRKRDTFGGFGSNSASGWPLSATDNKMAHSQSQDSRLSAPDHDIEGAADRGVDEEEMVVPEVKVSEIENHLAVVEAALQDNQQEGSFDPTSLRQSISSLPFQHANMSSASVLSPEFVPSADRDVGDVSMPGQWTSGTPYGMNDDGQRITLAPDSQAALADAVRSVRKAISTSQLVDTPDAPRTEAGRSVDTLGSTLPNALAEGAEDREGDAEASMYSEATPARAAKKRQEGMRDIEAAYVRMIALVQSTAIGASPSPLMRSEESRDGVSATQKKYGLLTPGMNQSYFGSPLTKSSNLSEDRSTARDASSGTVRVNNSLSGLMGMPMDGAKHGRPGSISSESSTLEAIRDSVADNSYQQRRQSSDSKSNTSRYSQLLSRDPASSSLSDGFRKRFSSDNTAGHTSSIGGHTSPSITAKTLGTPRSYNTSGSQQSFGNILRRHELEKESLLDSLERTRADVTGLQARNESLTADLHAEVTRVLELERELERRDAREIKMIGQIQDLESEVLELRYLDQHLNAVDRTLDSDEAESIMDIELPTSLTQKSRIDQWAQTSGQRERHATAPSSAKTGSLAQPFAAKPTHRSVRSEAFLSGFTGAGASSMPPSRSEQTFARPVSLVNGPAGLTREMSDRSGQMSPLTTPRSSSLLRPSKSSSKSGRTTQPASLMQSSVSDEGSDWKLADEQAPDMDDAKPEAPATRDVISPSSSSTARIVSAGRYNSALPRPSSVISKLGIAPSTNGTDAVPRSASSRLPRLGSKPGSKYNTASSSVSDRTAGPSLASIFNPPPSS